MKLRFAGEIVYWRGPAPFHFVPVPEEESAELLAASPLVSYGWGMIPGTARIGDTAWTTALWPKDGRYLVPVKADVRRAERLQVGDEVDLVLVVDF